MDAYTHVHRYACVLHTELTLDMQLLTSELAALQNAVCSYSFYSPFMVKSQ